MFTSQKDFYKSKEWTKLREIVISKRTHEDGFIYCDICHKPILKKYDLVLHHKTELNDINVNDVNISLNEDNLLVVHFKCHNFLHKRFGYQKTNYQVNKKVYIVYGSPCSGKSTWVKEIATEKDLIIDLDNIWQMISINNRYYKPEALKTVAFEVRDKLYDIVKYRSGKWHNAYLLTGGALKGDRDRLASRVGADDLIFIDTSKEECLKRVYSKGLPKEEVDNWIKYINEWFDTYQPSTPLD